MGFERSTDFLPTSLDAFSVGSERDESFLQRLTTLYSISESCACCSRVGALIMGAELPYYTLALRLFRDVIEISEELVELSLRDRIVLKIVAARTAHREAEPDG